ncbi:MAG: competence/damage-inducible protein A [Bacteroidales bacterium]|nr:competence/damage-inducible protein A [Bacteroidales bacterium]
MKKAVIVTIGDEILIGQVIDSNSAFIASELNKAGIQVYKIISIHDSREEIYKTLDEMIPAADVIIFTGGLGPTSDDITKPALAEYFNSDLVLHPEAMELLMAFLKKRNLELNDLNRNQALIPNKCNIIPNYSGTAMGMWFRNGGKNIISLPGVPFEMKEMVTNFIVPQLVSEYHLHAIIHKTIITSGLPESVMAVKIADWEKKLPGYIKLAYLPSPGILRLRLSTVSNGNSMVNEQLNTQVEYLKEIIGQVIVGFDNDTIESVVGKLLNLNSSSLSLAESCTGGNIARMVTSVPGSSIYFKGGIVAYSNEVKQGILKVQKQVLKDSGAVSEQTVTQMAEGCRLLFQTDYAVSVSGIAGPDGGTEEKPVGTVWIAATSNRATIARKFNFGDNRERNIHRASVAALNLLRLFILGMENEINIK